MRETTHALNGIRLHVREGEGSGPPLLLLHGFSGAGSDFGHLFDLDALSERSIAVDLRGHGRSTHGAWPLTHRKAAQDVMALLDRLAIRGARAIGLSFGGNVLLHVASARPELVAAMVIVSSTPRFEAQARALMHAAGSAEPPPAELARLRISHPDKDEACLRELWRQPLAFAKSEDDLAFGSSDLAAIGARTLIVHGDRDPLYPIELALELYRGIAQSELWIVNNGGHLPIFGPRREAFEREALRFLER